MEEKVGFRRGLSAASVLGLYAGFMLAVAVAVTFEKNALIMAAIFWAITIVVSAIFLTPILAKGRRRGRSDAEEDVAAVRGALESLNEGVGGWRTLSHIRGDGLGVSVSLSDSENPLLIMEKSLQMADSVRIIFRFSKNESSLRDRILSIVEERISRTRIQRRTKTITITTPQILDRGIFITRSMMICPPLMVLGAIGFSSISNGDSILAGIGAIAGLLLGVLVITNKGS
jgi:hypothetical protein